MKLDYVITIIVDAGDQHENSPTALAAPGAANRSFSPSYRPFAALLVGALMGAGHGIARIREVAALVWLVGVVLTGGYLALGLKALRRLRLEADRAPLPTHLRSA
jgi:hypothetical protein